MFSLVNEGPDVVAVVEINNADEMKKKLPSHLRQMKEHVCNMKGIDRSLRAKGLDGEGCDGLYGSISFTSQLVLTADLMSHGDLPDCPANWKGGEAPVVVDFGAGTGRALVFWTMLNMAKSGIGYELDSVKVGKAQVYMEMMVKTLNARMPIRENTPQVFHGDVSKITLADLAPHRPTLGYSFCAGMSGEPRRAMGDIFMNSRTMHSLVLVDYAAESSARVLRSVGLLEEGQDATALSHLYLYRVLRQLKPLGGHGSYTAHILTKRASLRGKYVFSYFKNWCTDE